MTQLAISPGKKYRLLITMKHSELSTFFFISAIKDGDIIEVYVDSIDGCIFSSGQALPIYFVADYEEIK